MTREEVLEAALKKANLPPLAAAAARRVMPRVYDEEHYFVPMEKHGVKEEEIVERIAKDLREVAAGR